MNNQNSTDSDGIESPTEDLDEQEIFFSIDQSEIDRLKIKAGQQVSYELCRGDNGRHYAINLEVVDVQEN
ncbi:hypothetical protein [Pseudomonas sp. GM55]|uniref:hypothetical protein n=1 Tax=Pseudomonas sp. GM55 TaxID=1144333 RepID=UPI000270BF04|nr:hypothetical protein [Pseudomonas sp. GM55]EJM65773.1 hypothetical protein PMI31_05593 [Pseudomonas sp. GM55]